MKSAPEQGGTTVLTGEQPAHEALNRWIPRWASRWPLQRGGLRMLPQIIDRGINLLPREHALAFDHFDEGRNFPHRGDGEVFNDDEVGGDEGFGQDVSLLGFDGDRRTSTLPMTFRLRGIAI